jgi:hypothetical protein
MTTATTLTEINFTFLSNLEVGMTFQHLHEDYTILQNAGDGTVKVESAKAVKWLPMSLVVAFPQKNGEYIYSETFFKYPEHKPVAHDHSYTSVKIN